MGSARVSDDINEGCAYIHEVGSHSDVSATPPCI